MQVPEQSEAQPLPKSLHCCSQLSFSAKVLLDHFENNQIFQFRVTLFTCNALLGFALCVALLSTIRTVLIGWFRTFRVTITLTVVLKEQI